MNSCKVASERQVQWALLAMQIGLAVALWAMREEYKDEHTKAENCADVASGERDKSLRAQACCDAGLIDKKSLEACVFDESEMGAIKTRCGALLKRAGELVDERDKTNRKLLPKGEGQKKRHVRDGHLGAELCRVLGLRRLPADLFWAVYGYNREGLVRVGRQFGWRRGVDGRAGSCYIVGVRRVQVSKEDRLSCIRIISSSSRGDGAWVASGRRVSHASLGSSRWPTGP